MVLNKKAIVLILLLVVGILVIGGMMLSNTSLADLTSIFQKPQSEYALQETSSYTPTTETHCVGNKCSYINYGSTVFTQEPDGEWYTFPEVSTVEWMSGAWRISYRDYWVEIEPFVVYGPNNNVYFIDDIKQFFPNVQISDYVSAQRFNHKFEINFSNLDQYPQLVSNIKFMGFRLRDSYGLTWDDVEKTGNQSILIKNKIEINYGDLIESHYTLNLLNKTTLLIGNISANIDNGVLSLDPLITLGASDNLADLSLCDNGIFGNCGVNTDYAGQYKWDLSSLCDASPGSVDSAIFSSYINGKDGTPDDDARVYFLRDQTWDESSIDAVLVGQSVYNLTTTVADGITWSSTTTTTYTNISVLTQAQETCTWGNNFTIRIDDPDHPVTPVFTHSSSGLIVFIGMNDFRGGEKYQMGSRTLTNKEPRLYIDYTAGNQPPQVNLTHPPDNTVSTNTTYNFSCAAGDSDGLASVSLFGNWSGGWHLIETNSSPVNYTNTTFEINLDLDYQIMTPFTQITENGHTEDLTTDGEGGLRVLDQIDQLVYHYNSTGGNESDTWDVSWYPTPNGLARINLTHYGLLSYGGWIVVLNATGQNHSVGCDISGVESAGWEAMTSNGTSYWATNSITNLAYEFDSACNNIISYSFADKIDVTDIQSIAMNGSDFWVGGGSLVHHLNSSFDNQTGLVSIPGASAINALEVDTNLVFGSPKTFYIGDIIDDLIYRYGSSSSGTSIWGCDACDTLSACDTSDTNFTLTVGTPGLTIDHLSPSNFTYNATDGLTTFICNTTSDTEIDEGWFEFRKYGGGLHINSSYNTSQASINGDNISVTVNLTNGWYSWNCNATNVINDFNETTQHWVYKTGKGKVYVQTAEHVEPRGVDYSTFNQILDLSDFQEGGNIDSAFVAANRYKYNDSYGHAVTRVWKLRMDQPICESTTGCASVIDAFLNDDWNYVSNPGIDGNISFWEDEVGLHIHFAEWFNWTNFTLVGGIGPWQPAEYYNQVLTINGTVYRIESDLEFTDKILAYFIVDGERYPRSSVVGWLGVTTQISNWYSDKVPFMYDNWYGTSNTDTVEPIDNIWDFTRAPREMYNPSATDYQVPGGNTNYIMQCGPGGLNDNVAQWEMINHTFALADEGLDNILCHFSHTYTGGALISDVDALHKCLNEDLWGNCGQGDDMATLYPEVKYVYTTGKDMVQKVLGKTDIIDPVITLEIVGDVATVTSDEDLWNPPLLGIVKTDGNYTLANLTTVSSTEWNVNIVTNEIAKMRAGALDTSFNDGYSTLKNNGINITFPTESEPISVIYPQNITINFTMLCLGACPTSGVRFVNATIGGVGVPNTTEPTFSIGSGEWSVNVSVPDLSGSNNLVLTINYTDTGVLSDVENDSVIFDSCVYGGTGNWVVNCPDNCIISSPVTIVNGVLILQGSGTFTIENYINGMYYIIKDKDCKFVQPYTFGDRW